MLNSRTHGATLSAMPELPDLSVYLECLEPRILGQPLSLIRLQSASLLRTVDPPISEAN